MKIWSMRFAFWVPKATDTLSEYLIFIVFPLQQWRHERASLLRYTSIVCLVTISEMSQKWWTFFVYESKTFDKEGDFWHEQISFRHRVHLVDKQENYRKEIKWILLQAPARSWNNEINKKRLNDR
jgi:hypothetical protein